jgi:protein-L-isoaspartate(D-aspartate) O-methyltransferase
MADASAARAYYAEELHAVCNLQSSTLVRALASVPREEFLGPGPWRVRGMEGMFLPGGTGTYRQTPDADPRHIYHNVLVSIDPSRELNNGHPGTLACWIDALGITDGCDVVHVGCGTGYYTAILAEIVGPQGSVVGLEIDATLAERARRSLAAWPNVRVVTADGVAAPIQPADVIFINAGATHPAPGWLDALRPGGRLLLPLTFEPAPNVAGKGGVLLVTREDGRLAARFVSMVQIYPCVGGRDAALNAALMQAFSRGGWEKVRSVRRDPHESGARCWLHVEAFCLSMD